MSVVKGEEISLAPKIEPVDLDSSLKFTIDKELPAGLTFDTETGVIGGTATETKPTEVYTVVCENATGKCEMEVKLCAVAASKKPRTLRRGEALEEPIELFDASDVGDGASFTCDNLPKGLVIDAATGAISGKPEESFDDGIVLNISKSDGSGGDPEVFEVALLGMDSAPEKLTYVDSLFKDADIGAPIENAVSVVKGEELSLIHI